MVAGVLVARVRPMREESNPIWLAAVILGAILAALKFGEAAVGTNRNTKAASALAQGQEPPPIQLPAVQPAPQQPYAAPTAPSYAPPPPEPEPTPSPTRDIYLCKGYGGGMFWSSAICSSQRATIDRIVTVPSNMSWDQQVAIAEVQKQEAAQLYVAPQATIVTNSSQPNSDKAAECVALDAHVRELDAMARKPQSGQMQDWIRGQRQEARTRQGALRC